MVASNEANSSFTDLIHRVTDVLREGVKHGHFDLNVQGEIGNGCVRHVIITAGKRYKFHISELETRNL